MDVVRALTTDAGNRVPHLAFQPDRMSNVRIVPGDEVISAQYLRMRAADKPGVLAEVASLLAGEGISIEAVVQKEPAAGEEHVHLIMLTQSVVEGRLTAALARIEASEHISGKVTRIRLEPLVGD